VLDIVKFVIELCCIDIVFSLE